jgi:DNA repair exonuclease SbcCD ATPase subunit
MRESEEELKGRMMGEVEGAIDRLLRAKKPAGEITLTEIEELVIAAQQAIGQELTAILIEASAEEQTAPGPACPGCGEEMHYKGKKEKWIISATGEVRMKRAYYYCERCGAGTFPPG